MQGVQSSVRAPGGQFADQLLLVISLYALFGTGAFLPVKPGGGCLGAGSSPLGTGGTCGCDAGAGVGAGGLSDVGAPA